ncbi:MAG: hypothetical protein M0Q88_05935 [Bacilli bacterium]|nr:hypothetical protein [Bacilli bacterium]
MNFKDLLSYLKMFLIVNFNKLITKDNALTVGILVATIIFIFWNRKFLINLVSGIMYGKKNNELSQRLKNVMETYGLSYEEAKNKIFMDEIADALEVNEDIWHVNRFTIIKRGDKVSFVDKEIGLIQGTFLGLIKPDLLGYDDIYVMKIDKTSKIRQAAISYVKEETINVY